MTDRGAILIVDDTPHNLDVLVAMLGEQGYDVRAALNGTMALQTIQKNPPDLILLDINMPQMNGYEVCQQIRHQPATRALPVIFISALDETLDKVKAFEVGGMDYITKPFQLEEVLARIETHLTLYRQRREIEALREKDRLYFEELHRTKDQFVRTASHDLKNPLGLITAYVDLLEKHGRLDDDKGQGYLYKIRRGADRMRTLVTDLLDLAKIETGMALERQPILLAPFLAECASHYELAAAEKDIHLTCDLPAQAITLSLDPHRMEQVIHNLLSNAIKYTPRGGQVELRAFQNNHQVTISVQDSGLGIPAADVPHIFEKFYRVKSDQHLASEGTGLGLAIVRTIVEQHGGQISVASVAGQGSTFSLRLPG